MFGLTQAQVIRNFKKCGFELEDGTLYYKSEKGFISGMFILKEELEFYEIYREKISKDLGISLERLDLMYSGKCTGKTYENFLAQKTLDL